MCETSNTPACSRTARCSSRTPAYWTGISQPANGTILAPAASCRSNSGVRFRVSAPGTAGRLAAPSRRAGGQSGTSVAVPAAARALDRWGDLAVVHREDRVLAALLRADVGGRELVLGLAHADRDRARSRRGGAGGRRGGGRGRLGRAAVAAASAAGRHDDEHRGEGSDDKPAHS